MWVIDCNKKGGISSWVNENDNKIVANRINVKTELELLREEHDFNVKIEIEVMRDFELFNRRD